MRSYYAPRRRITRRRHSYFQRVKTPPDEATRDLNEYLRKMIDQLKSVSLKHSSKS
jgi:hypothetical protein